MPEARLLKADGIDQDAVGGDLILMKLDTRHVMILNPTARVLWDVLDEFPSRSELLGLLCEAYAERPRAELERDLDQVLDTLTAQRFLNAA
jgi:hypothetical protein